MTKTRKFSPKPLPQTAQRKTFYRWGQASRNVVTFQGMRDQHGRTVGATFTLTVVRIEDAPETNGSHSTVASGTYVHVRVRGSRNGEDFGTARRGKLFVDEADAKAFANLQVAELRKAAARRFAPVEPAKGPSNADVDAAVTMLATELASPSAKPSFEIDAAIGELTRNGRTIFYAFVNGIQTERTSRGELIEYMLGILRAGGTVGARSSAPRQVVRFCDVKVGGLFYLGPEGDTAFMKEDKSHGKAMTANRAGVALYATERVFVIQAAAGVPA